MRMANLKSEYGNKRSTKTETAQSYCLKELFDRLSNISGGTFFNPDGGTL